jgi:hypothetical protein
MWGASKRVVSPQGAEIGEKIFQVFFTQALIEGGHRSLALDNRHPNLGVGGEGATGKRLSKKQAVQVWRLLV